MIDPYASVMYSRERAPDGNSLIELSMVDRQPRCAAG